MALDFSTPQVVLCKADLRDNFPYENRRCKRSRKMSISRRNFLRITTAATVTTALGGATLRYATAVEPNDLVITRTNVPLARLPSSFDGFRIVLLTDLHLHPFTSTALIQRTIELTNSLQPDLVLLGGDFVCGFAEAAFELGSMLKKLSPRHGVFAVLGNYDHYRGAPVVEAAFRENAIKLLMNEGVVLALGGKSIFLAGLGFGLGGISRSR